MRLSTGFLAAFAALPVLAQNITVADIQGSGWLSTYNGQTVRNLTGVVTAKVSILIFYTEHFVVTPISRGHLGSGLLEMLFPTRVCPRASTFTAAQ